MHFGCFALVAFIYPIATVFAQTPWPGPGQVCEQPYFSPQFCPDDANMSSVLGLNGSALCCPDLSRKEQVLAADNNAGAHLYWPGTVPPGEDEPNVNYAMKMLLGWLLDNSTVPMDGSSDGCQKCIDLGGGAAWFTGVKLSWVDAGVVTPVVDGSVDLCLPASEVSGVSTSSKMGAPGKTEFVVTNSDALNRKQVVLRVQPNAFYFHMTDCRLSQLGILMLALFLSVFACVAIIICCCCIFGSRARTAVKDRIDRTRRPSVKAVGPAPAPSNPPLSRSPSFNPSVPPSRSPSIAPPDYPQSSTMQASTGEATAVAVPPPPMVSVSVDDDGV
eukprot:TRINITY_DN4931_c0_g1_i1.p1 TRINITY_DN4931_c0_g1~~TRINITY_DN4931_c0_g1_i1.p1  ORF type:complete len:331 (-),score=42.99 TRINITY_DN4931_c0_g1_i1:959-1951(-)